MASTRFIFFRLPNGRRFFLTLGFLTFAGCLRTQVINEVTSIVPEAPFRRVLVCAFTPDPADASHLEDLLAQRLRKHRIVAETCDTVLPSTASVQELSEEVGQQFDAILITRRVPRPHPNTQEKDGIESVILAPKTTVKPTLSSKREDNPKPSTVEQFAQFFYNNRRQDPGARSDSAHASEETILLPYGKERYIYGAADLISVKENRLVWSLGGYIAGSKDQSTNRFLKLLSRRLENELDDYHLIP